MQPLPCSSAHDWSMVHVGPGGFFRYRVSKFHERVQVGQYSPTESGGKERVGITMDHPPKPCDHQGQLRGGEYPLLIFRP